MGQASEVGIASASESSPRSAHLIGKSMRTIALAGSPVVTLIEIVEHKRNLCAVRCFESSSLHWQGPLEEIHIHLLKSAAQPCARLVLWNLSGSFRVDGICKRHREFPALMTDQQAAG